MERRLEPRNNNHEPASNGEEAAKHHVKLVIFSTFVQALWYLRPILLLPILTRCLGVQLFGVWSKVFALVNLFLPLVGAGVGDGLARFIPAAEPEDRSKLIWTGVAITVVVGLFMAAGFAVLTPWLAPGLQKADPGGPEQSLVFRFIGFIVLAVALLHMTIAYFRDTVRPRAYGVAIATQLTVLLGIALLGWALMGRSLWVPTLTWTAGPFAVVAFLLWRISRDAAPKLSWAEGKKMIAFGLPLTAIPVLIAFIHFSDRIMLSWLLTENGDRAVGVFAANYSLGGIIALVASPFFTFLSPTAMKFWDQGQRVDAGKLIRQMAKFTMVPSVPIALVTPFIASPVVRLVAGRDFVTDPIALLLILISFCFQQLGSVVQIPLYMEKRSKTILFQLIIVGLTNIILNWLLIPLPDPWGGINGVAAATAVSFGLRVILCRVAVRHLIEIRMNWSAHIRLLLAAAAAAGLVWVSLPSGVVATVLVVLAVAVVYVGLILLFRVIDREEMRTVVSVLKDMRQNVATRMSGNAPPGDGQTGDSL